MGTKVMVSNLEHMPPQKKNDILGVGNEKRKLKNGMDHSMTIYIGPWEDHESHCMITDHRVKRKAKEIRLPYSNMTVSPEPLNQMSLLDQKQYKGITFSTRISESDNKTLIVIRTDCDQGWDFDLQLKAYYTEKLIETRHKEYDFGFKNEDSAVTISLKPQQKIYCVPEALLFKEQQVSKTVSEINNRNSSGAIIKGLMPDWGRGEKPKKVGSISASEAENKQNSKTFAEYSYLGAQDTRGIIVLGGHSSKLIHLSLGAYGNKIFCRKGTCLATSTDVKIIESGSTDSSFQSLIGHGDVFLQVQLAMKKIMLQDSEDILSVKDSCVIAFTQDMISRSEITDRFCGLILSKSIIARTLKGPGTIWLKHTRADIIGYERMGTKVTSGLGEGMVSDCASLSNRSSATKLVEEKDSVTSSDILSFASIDWDVKDEDRLESREEAKRQRQMEKSEAARLRAEVQATLQQYKAKQAEKVRLQAAELVKLQKQSRLGEENKSKQIESNNIPSVEEARTRKQRRQGDEQKVEHMKSDRRKAEEDVRLKEKQVREEKVNRRKAEEKIRLLGKKKEDDERKAVEAEAARLKAKERVRAQVQIKKEKLKQEQAKAARLRAEIEAKLNEQKRQERELRAKLATLEKEERIRLQWQKEQDKSTAEELEFSRLLAVIEEKFQKTSKEELHALHGGEGSSHAEHSDIIDSIDSTDDPDIIESVGSTEEGGLKSENTDSLSTVPVGDDSLTGWQSEYSSSTTSYKPVDYVIVKKESEDLDGDITMKALRAREQRIFGSKRLFGRLGGKYLGKLGGNQRKSDLTVSTKCTSAQTSKATSVVSSTSSLGPSPAQLRLYKQSETKQHEGRRRRKLIEQKIEQKSF